ncbi:uncharacterized protein LOC107623890 isoform X2 [Arachis ipaensis]|uniref:uncharacterized protein LOC107623890 isoform X2 n=1 Tax=Arachis ipaensis TaxID=130454 RepID=UPI000A2B5F77|nr:uncharacterized protein LOC107623890 isoform X2 [Arachis ipaensis]
MAEIRCLPVIEEDETIDEDFYEKIQAPKFVDLTAPDPRLPDEDRHWFCMRFGCDQKHEEELDSEAIYKDFVLRVMAARSPNVKLRKALNRREASENLKCPLTAPAKPRVSRMALISSLSHKMAENKAKVNKPLAKVSASATPNAKVKQSPSVAKALTTPRNQKKKVSIVEPFRTVQSKKALSVAVPKSRMVGKALVFHSPKRTVKIKSSVELKTPMRVLCSAMKKLELNGGKKNGEECNNSLHISASRKKLRGREVKSRVFDLLYSNNCKGPETNTVRCRKEKRVKGMEKCQVNLPHEENEIDSSDMEIDEKSRGSSLERCTESGISGGSKPTRVESSSEASVTTTLSNSTEEEKKTTEERKQRGVKSKPVPEKGENPEAIKRKDKEKSVNFDDKENQAGLTEYDDKENASAPDENRIMTTNNDPNKVNLGSKTEDSRNTDKKHSSITTSSQVVKYRKLKPTNPKPFKLRTDERGILKEANLDKKVPSQLKETTTKGGNLMRKHPIAATQSPGPKIKKQIDPENTPGHGYKLATSQLMQLKAVKPPSALSRKKGKVVLGTPCKLSVILEKPSKIAKPKDAAKPRQNDASPPTSNGAASNSKPCSRGRRTLTVPKEPKFHSLHVPRSCTIRNAT